MKLLILLFAGVAAFAQPKPAAPSVCKIVTQEDAEAILGPKAVQHTAPGSCAYDIPGQKIVFVVIVDSSPNVKQQILLPKQNVPKAGGVVQDEPSIAAGAYSTVIRQGQSIYMLKGNSAISVSVFNDAGPLPNQLDKLRPVAKRIYGRL